MKTISSALLLMFVACSNPTVPPLRSIDNNVTISDLKGFWCQTRSTLTVYDSIGTITRSDNQSNYVNPDGTMRLIVEFTDDSMVSYINYDSTSYHRNAESCTIFRGYYYDGIFDSTDTNFMAYFNEYAGLDDDLMEIELVKRKSLHLFYHEYSDPNPPSKKYSEKYEYFYEWLDPARLPASWPEGLVRKQ